MAVQAIHKTWTLSEFLRMDVGLDRLKKVIIHNGISWDFGEILLGFHGISWDFMGFHGISWDFMASQCFSFLHSVPLGLIWWSAPWVLSHLSHTRPAGPGAGSISSLAFRRLTLNIAGFHSSPDTLLRDLGPAARIMVFEIQRNLGVQLGLWVYKKPQEVGIF